MHQIKEIIWCSSQNSFFFTLLSSYLSCRFFLCACYSQSMIIMKCYKTSHIYRIQTTISFFLSETAIFVVGLLLLFNFLLCRKPSVVNCYGGGGVCMLDTDGSMNVMWPKYIFKVYVSLSTFNNLISTHLIVALAVWCVMLLAEKRNFLFSLSPCNMAEVDKIGSRDQHHHHITTSNFSATLCFVFVCPV